MHDERVKKQNRVDFREPGEISVISGHARYLSEWLDCNWSTFLSRWPLAWPCTIFIWMTRADTFGPGRMVNLRFSEGLDRIWNVKNFPANRTGPRMGMSRYSVSARLVT
jgi:hypothetical protein